MSELNSQVLPDVLEVPFGERIQEGVTHLQYQQSLFNYEQLGIGKFLDERAADLGYDGLKARWDTYRHILNGITDSTVEADFAQDQEYTTTRFVFRTAALREDFHTISHLLHNGIAVRPPQLYDDTQQEVRATNYTYAEACAIGRTGTMLLVSSYPELRQNIRAVRHATLGAIHGKVFAVLPEHLQEQVTEQTEAMGAIATESMFVSGAYGLVGYKFREIAATLNETERQQFLRVQRKTRPLSERNVLWIAKPNKGDTLQNEQDIGGESRVVPQPISQGSLSRSAIAPTVNMITDTYESAKRREFIDTAVQTWDILRELGGSRGIGSVARAGILFARVLTKAVAAKHQDARLLRKLKQ